MNIPYGRKVFIKSGPTGARIFEKEPDDEETDRIVQGVCYPVGEMEQISDFRGSLVVSSTKLYIPGSIELNVQDSIIFEGREQTIHKIAIFYRNGVPDVKVVYL